MERILTEDERWVLLNALAAAKDEYTRLSSLPFGDISERQRQQFHIQAGETVAMYDMIEQADAISLAPPAEEDVDAEIAQHERDSLAIAISKSEAGIEGQGV